jgi:hypothetical protein
LTTDNDITRGCICGGVVLAATLALALSCAGTSSVRFGDTVDVSGYPKEIQAAYEVFAVRCSRCHTLARPLNARITNSEHWVRYVTRMRRNPSSGINPKDAQIVLQFLLYYTQRVVEKDSRGQGDTTEAGSTSAPAPLHTNSAPQPAAARGESDNPTASEGSMTEPAGPVNTSIDGGAP